MGRRVRSSREHQRLTQRELARRAGITQASLSNYETGKREMSLFVALAVSDALRVPLGALVPVPGMTVATALEAGHAEEPAHPA